MKKLVYFLIIACCSYIAQAQIQQEDFNAASIPVGWSATTPASGCAWQFGYTGTLPGTQPNPTTFASGGVIFDDNACGSGQNNRIELEGPEVDLVAANITSVAIEIIYNHQAFLGDGNFIVEVWDGSNWQNVLTVSDDAPSGNSGANTTSIIDVTTHINANFKVKFIYDDENTFSHGMGLDDYKLIDTATASIEDLISDGFSYYPNPVIENNLTLSAKDIIRDVIVFNVLGQKVYQSKPNVTKSDVQMSHLPVGAYIVNVAVGEKKGAFKILKQ